jgi:hypothetical protein
MVAPEDRREERGGREGSDERGPRLVNQAWPVRAPQPARTQSSTP